MGKTKVVFINMFLGNVATVEAGEDPSVPRLKGDCELAGVIQPDPESRVLWLDDAAEQDDLHQAVTHCATEVIAELGSISEFDRIELNGPPLGDDGCQGMVLIGFTAILVAKLIEEGFGDKLSWSVNVTERRSCAGPA